MPVRSRTDAQFFNVATLPTEPSSPFAVVGDAERLRLLSRDEATGANTYLGAFPAGVVLTDISDDASVELFVCSGELEAESVRLGAGGYVSAPQHQTAPEVRITRPVTAVVLVNPDPPAFGPPLTVPEARSTWEQAWEADVPGAHSLFHKKVRRPDFSGDWLSDEASYDGGPGGYLRLVLIAPGGDGRQHTHHECWEEFLLLQGDVLIGERGHLGPGSYMGNPQEFWHAPFASQGGALALVQTDGPMGIPFTFRDRPGGPELVDAYLTGRDLLAAPEHVEWAESDAVRSWSAQFPAAAAHQGEPWAGEAPHDRASQFRARSRLARARSR